jgi:hypothetical protein
MSNLLATAKTAICSGDVGHFCRTPPSPSADDRQLWRRLRETINRCTPARAPYNALPGAKVPGHCPLCTAGKFHCTAIGQSSWLNQVTDSDRAGLRVPATKGIKRVTAPSRRSILVMLAGLALARLARPLAALASAPRDDLVIRDGWILRPDDLARLGLA